MHGRLDHPFNVLRILEVEILLSYFIRIVQCYLTDENLMLIN